MSARKFVSPIQGLQVVEIRQGIEYSTNNERQTRVRNDTRQYLQGVIKLFMCDGRDTATTYSCGVFGLDWHIWSHLAR
jgi:hypothetical protein